MPRADDEIARVITRPPTRSKPPPVIASRAVSGATPHPPHPRHVDSRDAGRPRRREPVGERGHRRPPVRGRASRGVARGRRSPGAGGDAAHEEAPEGLPGGDAARARDRLERVSAPGEGLRARRGGERGPGPPRRRAVRARAAAEEQTQRREGVGGGGEERARAARAPDAPRAKPRARGEVRARGVARAQRPPRNEHRQVRDARDRATARGTTRRPPPRRPSPNPNPRRRARGRQP